MGHQLSSDEQQRKTTISLTRDPAGNTSPQFSLQADIQSERSFPDKEGTKSRGAVRQNHDFVAPVNSMSPETSGFHVGINQLPLPTIVCDTGHKILAVNKKFQEFTGFAAPQCIGKTFEELLGLSEQIPFPAEQEPFAETGKKPHVELDIDTVHKTRKYTMLTTQLLHDSSGKPLHRLIQLVDLTHIKETEAELQKRSDELEKFVYSTSHDLRAPLRSIMGLVYIIQQETDPDAIRTYLEMIRSSVNRMDGFIKEIVDLSRNSRQPMNREEINLREIITDIFDSLRFAPGAEKIDFILTIKQAKPFISDQSRIKVILNNLIANAILYHRLEQEHPFIEVRINVTSKYCHIEVIDNGRGIQKEHQAKIFDMFYRASDDAKGSGLGLYIVKEAVQKLNGEIRIKSAWGEGTTFSLKFFNHTL